MTNWEKSDIINMTRKKEEYKMSDVAQLSNEIEMLSYSDRIFLLKKLVKSFDLIEHKKMNISENDFDKAFGIWKDNDIDIKDIRKKAWSRT